MNITEIWEKLAIEQGGTIVYLILDGLGGIQDAATGLTEMQAAATPNLDALAKRSSCGLLEIIGAGITPGSGPGHLALFGYDPLTYNIGRGVFSALGIGFPLQEGDVPARINFCTVDSQGAVTDRRAGRIDTASNEKLCAKLREGIKLEGVSFFIETESEHRAVLVLRGKNLQGEITDTDPGRTEVKPLTASALTEKSEKTASVIHQFLLQAQELLQSEHPANMILLRGFDTYRPVPSIKQRFHLDGLCIAEYPMYKGVSRFLGMDVVDSTGGVKGLIHNFKEQFAPHHQFYFLHVKYPDKAGEDKNFQKKVKAIEEVDRFLPEILALNPDVLVITGDHSTPAAMGLHSWHPVPMMLHSKNARIDQIERFDELACIQGGLGMRHAVDLMGLSLAHAGRLKKFGA